MTGLRIPKRVSVKMRDLLDADGNITMPCRGCMQPFTYKWKERAMRRYYCSKPCCRYVNDIQVQIRRKAERARAREQRRLVREAEKKAAPRPRRGEPQQVLGSGDWDKI